MEMAYLESKEDHHRSAFQSVEDESAVIYEEGIHDEEDQHERV